MLKRLNNIWGWWLGLTVFYLLFWWLNSNFSDQEFGKFTGLIGLFVPIGFYSGVNIFIENDGFVLLPVVMLIVFFAVHQLLKMFSLPNLLKVLIILLTLFLSTLFMDLALYELWASWQIFQTGDIW